MVKAKKEAKMKQAVQYREEFRALLKSSPLITHESTLDQVASVLGKHEIWQKVDRADREIEIRDYISKLLVQAREVGLPRQPHP